MKKITNFTITHENHHITTSSKHLIIQLLFCFSAFLLFPLQAQEKKMFIYYHNGTVYETFISEIDSIKFSGQSEVSVTFIISDATKVGNTATFNASVAANATVTDKGICYSSTNNTPTTNDSKVSKGSGTGDFIAKLSDLIPNTSYYARPYAIVNGTTFYSSVKTFTTLDCIEINGVVWARYNVAAHGVFVSNPENYGAFFQWGRKGDGHEQHSSLIHSGTVSSGFDANGQILDGESAHGKFITTSSSTGDWRSPQIDTLWNTGTGSSPIKTANDPCPSGWRVPTYKELLSLVISDNSEGELNGISGRNFGSGTNRLFFPKAGFRWGDGKLDEGSIGYYWTCTENSTNAYYLSIYDFVGINAFYIRSFGFPVRCVSE